MLLVNQQQDFRSMIIIGSHPSVPEFLLIYSRHAPTDAIRTKPAKLPQD
jgi:hypothetical protein